MGSPPSPSPLVQPTLSRRPSDELHMNTLSNRDRAFLSPVVKLRWTRLISHDVPTPSEADTRRRIVTDHVCISPTRSTRKTQCLLPQPNHQPCTKHEQTQRCQPAHCCIGHTRSINRHNVATQPLLHRLRLKHKQMPRRHPPLLRQPSR